MDAHLFATCAAPTSPKPLRDRGDSPSDTDAAVHSLFDEGRQTWPSIRLTLDAFAALASRHMAAHLPPSNGDARGGTLSPELFLAAACVANDPAAAPILERGYLARIPHHVARIAAARRDGTVDDFMQVLRERLLMGHRSRPARLADYSGRGPLGAWIRVVAVRLAIETYRRKETCGEEVPIACGLDADLDHLRGLHEPTFKACLEEAFSTLSSAERLVLRLTYCERMTGDTMAAALGIDRSNVVRRVVRARLSLYDATRAAMRRRIPITDTEFQSVARALAAHVEISLSRVLGAKDPV